MPPSFRKIDYSVRPAKHAERKMLLEIFRHLSAFSPLSQYRYVGMGSVWFSDFQLFHRALGIPDVVSIEREKDAKQRILNNVPFGAITPIFESTSKALPLLDWAKRQFVWLDYDDPISPAVLGDIESVIIRARSGSVVAVSVQTHAAKEVDEAGRDGSAMDLFKSRFARGLLPDDFGDDDLYRNAFARLSRNMVTNTVEGILASRKSGSETDLSYHKICDIEYADGVSMTTTVGVLVSSAELPVLHSTGLDSLDFVTHPDIVVKISVPKITPRKARFLEAQLPSTDNLESAAIPESEARAFALLYRYLPNFASYDP